MRLAAITISDFRSITRTDRMVVGNSLTLIGPNNEGKSNIVLAVVTALRLLQEATRERSLNRDLLGISRFLPFYAPRREKTYDWERDYPVGKQDNAKGQSKFLLEFELSEDERIKFRSAIGSQINGTLPVEIKVGQNSPEFVIKKQGRGGKSLSTKALPIARFIGTHLRLTYIPAIRSASDAQRVVDRVIESALTTAEKNEDFAAALETIQKAQYSAIQGIEKELHRALKHFLPNIKSIKVDVSAESRSRALRSADIIVNDGIATPLSRKGDGVVSLVAMGLLGSDLASSSDLIDTILAFEEPEAHLHPRAIHLIRRALDSISADRQIIVTTHSPMLVNRRNVSANIIVEKNKTRIPTSISEVRSSLGVRLSDNLSHARCVILCEGTCDEILIRHAAQFFLPDLEASISSGDVAFQSLGGVGNLSHHASSARAAASEVVAFVDDDSAASQAIKSAESDKVLEKPEVICSKRVGFSESELEDLFDQKYIESICLDQCNIDFSLLPKNLKKKKFSDRARFSIESSGIHGIQIDRLKIAICDAIKETSECRIHESKRGPLLSLERLVNSKLRTDI